MEQKLIRILFLCEQHPCPPSNGLYVPFYELVKRLRCLSNLCVELALPSKVENLCCRGVNSDAYFHRIYYLPIRTRSKLKILLDLVFFKRPPYSIDMEIPAEFLEYDAVIAVPDGFVETLKFIKRTSPSTFTMLYMGELYSTVMLGQLLNDLPHMIRRFPRFLCMGIKYFMIYLHEKCYLDRVDAIVVQNKREMERFELFRGKSWQTRVFMFTNPMKHELLQHNVMDNVILIHAPRSPDEIQLFIEGISNYIKVKKLDFVIRVCVKNDQIYREKFGAYDHVEIMGYQDNILDVYRDVFCAVVLTRQRFGTVNRVKESMTAGVAVVAYAETFRTVGETEDQCNGIYARNNKEFVQQVINLMHNRDLVSQIGARARQFILANETHSPDRFIQDLLSAISKPCLVKEDTSA